MKIHEMFPSRFLSGDELRGPVPVVIAGVIRETVYRLDEGETEVFVMRCEKASKGVILSRTLAKEIAEILGDDTDLWRGKQVVLYPKPVKVFGEEKMAIRARAVA